MRSTRQTKADDRADQPTSRRLGDEASDGHGPRSVGQRLRSERERQRIGLRELARRVGVSASLISQIELGRATPSVGTLYTIVNELNMSLDELFFEASDGSRTDVGGRGDRSRPAVDAANGVEDVSHPPTPAAAVPVATMPGQRSDEQPVVRSSDRQKIHLGSGVTWERMSPDTGDGVDFLYVVYDVGGASAPERSLIRHAGHEYGHVLEGRLGVTVGFDTYELLPGDAISFDSTTPHRLFNAGEVSAKAIWFVVGRDDPRVTRAGSESNLPQ